MAALFSPIEWNALYWPKAEQVLNQAATPRQSSRRQMHAESLEKFAQILCTFPWEEACASTNALSLSLSKVFGWNEGLELRLQWDAAFVFHAVNPLDAIRVGNIPPIFAAADETPPGKQGLAVGDSTAG
jgi:hypothetical protein